MATIEAARTSGSAEIPTFGEFFKTWLKIGCINFGGPAGQIAMMHRVMVDEKFSSGARMMWSSKECKALHKAHNHPSGSLKPSRADEELTIKIKEAAKWLDIGVLDHIIITAEGYYSFADEGLV